MPDEAQEKHGLRLSRYADEGEVDRWYIDVRHWSLQKSLDRAFEKLKEHCSE
jgi:hypothetical protein